MTNKNRYLMYTLLCFAFYLPIDLYAQKIPKWVIQPESLYDSEEYLFGVGEGSTMEIAKNQAFVSLSSIFGATIKQNVRTQESLRQTGDKVSSDVEIKDDTILASEHNLVNVEIKKTMHDRKNKKYYALAVMPKSETADILYNMIIQNIKEISSYSEISSKENDLLKKYSLMIYAAQIAEKNDVYAAQIFHLNKAMSENLSTSIPETLTSQYLYSQAHNIISKVTFGVLCESASVASVVKKMLGDMDFVVNNKAPVYIFDEEWDIKGSHMFGMYSMDYTLFIYIKDAQSNENLKTFSFSGKEIGRDELDAKKNAQNYLSKTMGDTLSQQFTEYLNSLLDVK